MNPAWLARMTRSGELTSDDIYLFREGTHARLYRYLGAHPTRRNGTAGTAFAVWAPNAAAVSVKGDFNRWDAEAHPLVPRSDGSGIWETFIDGVGPGAHYKYHIASRHRDYRVDKGDPFAFSWEEPPRTASRVASLDYAWNDSAWMASRERSNALAAPWSVYEVHLGSWRRAGEHGEKFLSYREIAEPLAEYVQQTGFTHVEFMPLTEHPFYGSWGYQTTGYFAPSARYGSPQDLMDLIDYLHQRGIGVLLDWVPSHFPGDEHGLAYFDGSHLYEHQDPRQGYHPEWNSYIFNYGRNEVRGFLLSSALFWLDKYHVDGIRVDAVASMLYLDYGRRQGEWIPNEFGGRENLEAMSFLRTLNTAAYRDHPGIQMVAEESTAWPMVSRPVELGGLGFGMKWNMGWMHDTLNYMSNDPVHRRYHQHQLTFGLHYAFSENFKLPLSHDEVVYGKGSLFNKMPGDDWQKFANLRLLLGYMWAHPGKQLLFMGGEFGQRGEWNHDRSLDWHLLDEPGHAGLRQWVADLNRFYRSEPALWQYDFDERGFEWLDASDAANSALSFVRKGDDGQVVVVCNFTPVPRHDYRVGVHRGGVWEECLNSDAEIYGGSGAGNLGRLETEPTGAHGRNYSLNLTLPPLGILLLKRQPTAKRQTARRKQASAAGA
jgi:1,4-alpha-glucan branching enzyme